MIEFEKLERLSKAIEETTNEILILNRFSTSKFDILSGLEELGLKSYSGNLPTTVFRKYQEEHGTFLILTFNEEGERVVKCDDLVSVLYNFTQRSAEGLATIIVL